MKNAYYCVLPIFLLMLLGSCGDEEDIHPVCGKAKSKSYDFVCLYPEDTIEIFRLTEQPPVFAEGEQDIMEYFQSNLQFCGLEDIDDGSMRILININELGESCLELIWVNNLYEDSVIQAKDLLDSFPRWTPGMSRGQPVLYQVLIRISIENGEITQVTF